VAPKRPGCGGEAERLPRNEIDHFILARLEKEGLKPSEPADKYALVRRVYLDLIDCRAPEEADAFVNILRRTLSRRWWIICWNHRITASVGAALAGFARMRHERL